MRICCATCDHCGIYKLDGKRYCKIGMMPPCTEPETNNRGCTAWKNEKEREVKCKTSECRIED